MLPFLCRLTYIVNDGRKLKHVIDTTTFTYIRKNMSSSGRYRIRKLMTLSFILYDKVYSPWTVQSKLHEDDIVT